MVGTYCVCSSAPLLPLHVYVCVWLSVWQNNSWSHLQNVLKTHTHTHTGAFRCILRHLRNLLALTKQIIWHTWSLVWTQQNAAPTRRRRNTNPGYGYRRCRGFISQERRLRNRWRPRRSVWFLHLTARPWQQLMDYLRRGVRKSLHQSRDLICRRNNVLQSSLLGQAAIFHQWKQEQFCSNKKPHTVALNTTVGSGPDPWT